MAKNKIVEADITDLNFDDKNFNKGTQFGQMLVEKSFQKHKAGRSILIDKNNNIIGGNKSTETYGALGGKKILIVETDGDTLVAVKRTDIDLDSPAGRELALADNASAKANILFDAEMIEAICGEAIAEEYGIDLGVKDEFGNDFSLADGEKPPFEQITFTLATEQAAIVKNAIAEIKATDEFKYAETMGNENGNGNALYLIMQQWTSNATSN